MATDPYLIDIEGSNIHAEAEVIRAKGPAVRAELPGGVLAWWITDYILAKQLLLDKRVSRDTFQHWPAWDNGHSELAKSWPLAFWVSDKNMINAYGSEHKRLRTLTARAFSAHQSRNFMPQIIRISHDLLDNIERDITRGQVFDIRSAFARPLPLILICEILGVDGYIREGLIDGIETMMDTSLDSESVHGALDRVRTLIHEFIDQRREDPAGDLTSRLIEARDSDNGTLTNDELIDTILLTFTAGHETTINLLDNTIVHVLGDKNLLGRIDAGEITWADIVEESLRTDAPFTNLPMRYAVERIELEDSTIIEKGDPIVISFGAAGRDPGIHGSDSDVFDPTRATRKEHISFGHGVHRCLGETLARLEAVTSLPLLFERFPTLKLAVPQSELCPINSFVSNGHQQIPTVIE